MRAKRTLLVSSLLLLSLFTGCEKKRVVEKVAIEVTKAPSGREVSTTVTVTDPKEVDRLEGFFPHMGEGKKSSAAGAWKTCVTLKFPSVDGRVVTVTSNYAQWSEGSGDWPTDPGFSKYIESLVGEP